MNPAEVHETAIEPPPPPHYSRVGDLVYAGTHLIIDVWGATNLDDAAVVERMLIDVVGACGATLLDLKLRVFEPHGGITAFATLEESHATMHTWPEQGYAAADIFTCGKADPYRALPVICAALEPRNLTVTEQKRGLRLLSS